MIDYHHQGKGVRPGSDGRGGSGGNGGSGGKGGSKDPPPNHDERLL